MLKTTFSHNRRKVGGGKPCFGLVFSDTFWNLIDFVSLMASEMSMVYVVRFTTLYKSV